MSKFLLNLLLQISIALVNSKIQFLIQKFFFHTFGPADLAAHSAFGLASPLASLPPQAENAPVGPPSTRVGRVFTGIRFPFWFAPSELAASRLSAKWGRAISFVFLPRRPTIAAFSRRLRPPRTARPPTLRCPVRYSLHALIPLLNPSSSRPTINGVKAITAGRFPLPRPSVPSPGHYKRTRSTPRPSPHSPHPQSSASESAAPPPPSVSSVDCSPPSPSCVRPSAALPCRR
jgi:hypothetical protein